jgi:hypothetical protein
MARNKVYEQLVNADLGKALTAMYATVDRLQTAGNPGEQVAGAAILFRLLCERFGMDLNDTFTATGRMIREPCTKDQVVQLAAARQYLKEQLR